MSIVEQRLDTPGGGRTLGTALPRLEAVFRAGSDALRPVAGVAEIQVAGAIPDAVAHLLRIPTAVRTVLIHPEVVRHIVTQRESGAGDAEFVLEHLPRAVTGPYYCGCDPRHGNRFDLVYLAPPEGRPLVVAIKLVPAAAAASGSDELWISTGHPLGFDFLERKRRWRDHLIPVPPPADEQGS
jgi:hypothetical protein